MLSTSTDWGTGWGLTWKGSREMGKGSCELGLEGAEIGEGGDTGSMGRGRGQEAWRGGKWIGQWGFGAVIPP